MKLALLLPVLLSGCALVATTTFDPMEYNHWLSVSYTAHQTRKVCGTEKLPAAVENLTGTLEYATLYSSSKILNSRIASAAQTITSLTAELKARTNPSLGYCEIKVLEIELAAKAVAESLSKKEM